MNNIFYQRSLSGPKHSKIERGATILALKGGPGSKFEIPLNEKKNSLIKIYILICFDVKFVSLSKYQI